MKARLKICSFLPSFTITSAINQLYAGSKPLGTGGIMFLILLHFIHSDSKGGVLNFPFLCVTLRARRIVQRTATLARF